MIEKVSKALCCGCRACESACPKSAIRFEKDANGFSYPHATDACISCGKCLKVCPVNTQTEPQDKSEIKVYALQNKASEILSESSSGGVFFELASYIIQNGGVVFGAAFDENLKLSHVAAETTEELKPLMGSKYLQSDMRSALKQVKETLVSGRLVLYSGTPCQIKALHRYLGKAYENLYTVDVICHGAPSQAHFDRYVQYIEKKYHSRIKSISFRNKSNGWKNFCVKLCLENGKVIIEDIHKNLYMRAFLKNLSLRESCFQCSANNYRSGSDLTMGDFWNIERTSATFSDDRGCSGVMIHSEKGQKLLEAVKNRFVCEEQSLELLVKYNHVLETSVKKPANYDAFAKAYFTLDLNKTDDMYLCGSFTERLKKRLWKILK
ncbi:MAG: Coenzyme F420 hydrogenase/dehydrogenase, beta subunit C-terminal domain [Clostridia bacterium]|nr:Coenzyme F420 hydrogenase/dehydrogenase, beta subunit C-terminal domain [Clostridia bacterium]